MKINYKKIFFCLLFAIFYAIFIKITGTALYVLLKFLNKIPDLISVINYLLLCVILFFILKKLKLLGILKEKGNGFWYGIKVGAFIVCLGIFSIVDDLPQNISQGQIQPFIYIVAFCLDMLFVGITEEIVFRGIIQNKIYECFDMKTRKGIYMAIICSGLIFGSCHILNSMSGISFRAALMQATGVSGMGIYFSAIYYRSNNIYSMIALHAFNDFANLTASGIWGIGDLSTVVENYNIYALVGFAFYLALSLFLLRKSKLNQLNKEIDLKNTK